MTGRIIIVTGFLLISSSLYAAEVAEQPDRFADTQKNIMRLKEYLKEAQTKKGELERKVEQLNNMIKSKDAQIDSLSSDYNYFKEEVEKKTSSQKELNEDMYKELNNLKIQVGQKEAGMAGSDVGKSSLLDIKIAELNDLVTSLRNANVYLERQVSQKDAEKVNLELRLGDAKNEANRVSLRNEELQKKISELTELLRDRDRDASGTLDELKKLKDRATRQELELSELKRLKDSNEDQIKYLKSRVETNQISKADSAKADSLSIMLDRASQERNDLLALQENIVNRLGEVTAVNIYLQEKLLDIFKELGAIAMQDTPDNAKLEALFKKVETVLEVATAGSEE